jgi:hypothetical protein
MINIISKSVLAKTTNGPAKVVHNLIKGLDIIKYPYIINKALNSAPLLWIHDDLEAYLRINQLDERIKILVGPNFAFPPLTDKLKPRFVLLQPSAWARDFCLKFRYDQGPVEAWATGIDVADFSASTKAKTKVLIYFKERYPWELDFAVSILAGKGLDFEIIRYGNYKESDYKNLLSQSKYIIWIGRQESQGIALQEALASDVPIIVWDVKNIGHWQPLFKHNLNFFSPAERAYDKTTSAPYFSDKCGRIILEKEQLAEMVDYFETNRHNFQPREYLASELSLEKKARDFLAIYKKYFQADPDSYGTDFFPVKQRYKKWRNDFWHYRQYYLAREYFKKIIKPYLTR